MKLLSALFFAIGVALMAAGAAANTDAWAATKTPEPMGESGGP